MKTITVKVENERDAALLDKLLKEAKFESKVETYIEEDDLNDEELRILEDRMEAYRKDPSTGKSLEEVNEMLKRKYGV